MSIKSQRLAILKEIDMATVVGDDKRVKELGKELISLVNPRNKKYLSLARPVEMSVENYYKLKKEGLKEREIAASFGMSNASLYRFKADNGIMINREQFDKTKEDYLALRDKGLANYQIAKEWHISEYTLKVNRKKWGLES